MRQGLSVVAVMVLGVSGPIAAAEEISAEASLGRALYFDVNLSNNRTQSCATCHNPAHGFVDERDNGVGGMASLGDDGRSLGDRNAPTASYASFSPEFHWNEKSSEYIGGQFHDGRESNLEGQAGGPPTNPIEMGMKDKATVVARIRENDHYVAQFRQLYGEEIFSSGDQAYGKMTEAIAAFERTDFFAPFDSKYDRYLRGEVKLTPQEELGEALFFSTSNVNCSSCHKLNQLKRVRETFTNYEYHNIGVPVNLALRAKNGIGSGHVDHGLLENPEISDHKHDGKYKVPTLRNIAVTGPYMHNGVFRDLKTVVEFYDQYNNTMRKNNPETGQPWRSPEVAKTVNPKELKAARFTDKKVDALVAFMRTLTDQRFEHLLD